MKKPFNIFEDILNKPLLEDKDTGDLYNVYIHGPDTFSIDMGLSLSDGVWYIMNLNKKQLIELFGKKQVTDWLHIQMAKQL